ncbi:hypothetical protein L3Y34_011267 [Caenorhabditis briggsae]|uniref:HTH_48 domain-containing protein n=1 Tax=Caenorhabditis briggsae TaxID=6238 RepID=A0AAE9CUT9_CAEBR|nr:hypothetical protein L3Y34_011267 [Caenorhabditis briggsae]
MSTILEPRSENFKRTMLCGYCSAGLSAEAAVESLAADFPALTTQEVSAWFARFRAGNFEIGENVSINAEGIVIDRSVRLKRELDDAEQVDGEPLARMNPNLPVVPKREVDEEDGANQHPQVNGAANHIVAQQQPAPHNLPIVAVNENPANGGPQVVPNIEEEDGEGADHARANPANEGNQAPAINRNQREARARPVRRAQRAVAIPPQNPVHPMPIQPAMYPVNLANQFPPVPLLFQITPQFLPEMQFYQFGVQFPMHYWQHQNPPNIEDSLRPFEASTRGMEKFNGMLSCRHSPDHAIYFEIMRYGLKFTKLENINAEGIVVDQSMRLKRELDDEEHSDGEPPARINLNPLIVPKRKMSLENKRTLKN